MKWYARYWALDQSEAVAQFYSYGFNNGEYGSDSIDSVTWNKKGQMTSMTVYFDEQHRETYEIDEDSGEWLYTISVSGKEKKSSIRIINNMAKGTWEYYIVNERMEYMYPFDDSKVSTKVDRILNEEDLMYITLSHEGVAMMNFDVFSWGSIDPFSMKMPSRFIMCVDATLDALTEALVSCIPSMIKDIFTYKYGE